MPAVHIPSRDELAFAVNTARTCLPSPPRLAYYSGLGLLAVFDVLEWPVAVAIGIGAVVAQRAARRVQTRS
ncbi:hypothetical protein [Saccharopolyspora sp. ASAGF58]|uniref:hypothetical protein n=1 Tax=Saccharopolyspora sp. ASAGF58 TaxID=2719023 RepID=UPI00143FC4FF|nr:hypothetical protein [Saccharopolyspora sp. ASAGF58]QIZ35815.1 hypothetical protein FDZ84_15300 [Saccharopolyspora sp. ASAGF58]